MGARKELKEFLLKYPEITSYKFFHEVKMEIWKDGKDEREVRYKKGREKSVATKARKIARGEVFKQTIKVGDVVKMEGTNDILGVREVMETDEGGVTCRKIIKHVRTTDKERKVTFHRDSYITTHGWNKINRLLNIKIQD